MSRTEHKPQSTPSGKRSMKRKYQREEKKKFRRVAKKIGDSDTDLAPVTIKNIYWRYYW